MSAASIFLPSKQGNRIEYSANNTFTPPEGVRFVTVMGCGGGQAGNNLGDKNGGVGAAFGIKSVAVTPGVGVSINIGAGGTVNGEAGDDSSFGSLSFKGADDASSAKVVGSTVGGFYDGVISAADSSVHYSGGLGSASGGGGGAGPFGPGGDSNVSAGSNTGGGGGGGSSWGSGGSGKIIVIW